MATLEQLIAAGLPATETDGDKNASFSRGLTPAEWVTFLQLTDPERAAPIAARMTIENIPSWATWTPAEWATYFNANLSQAEIDKVTAKIMLARQNAVIDKLALSTLALIKMVIKLQRQAGE